VHLPAAASAITESGRPLGDSPRILREEQGETVVEVGSGQWRFEVNGAVQ
jgi:hypothetical protein